MWWSCFTWDHKGPYHIWTPETAAEKASADAILAEYNKAIEPRKKALWELTTQMKRVNLDRNQGGRKPRWIWSKKTGKLIREAKKGGIDWWRYRNHVLIPKLIPFAQEVEKRFNNEATGPINYNNLPPATYPGPERPWNTEEYWKGLSTEEALFKIHEAIEDGAIDPISSSEGDISPNRLRAIVQEDKAPAHNHESQQAIYNFHRVCRLLWPGITLALIFLAFF